MQRMIFWRHNHASKSTLRLSSWAVLTINSEETQEDVRARMYAIQENELEQLRELTGFLDTEINFVQQYLDVLKEAKTNWIDE